MKKGDWTVLLISFLSAGLLIGINFLSRVEQMNGKEIAVIMQDGSVVYSLALDQIKKNKVFEIRKGDMYNTVEAESGRIRFLDSNCPNKTCVKTGWISRPGEMAVCMPHHILIEIRGDRSDVDAVTY